MEKTHKKDQDTVLGNTEDLGPSENNPNQSIHEEVFLFPSKLFTLTLYNMILSILIHSLVVTPS